MKYDKDRLLLYAVTDRRWLNGKTLTGQVEAAMKGGATLIQLREKEMDEPAFLEEAREIQNICRKYKVPFVINDNVRIAAAIQADGVHVGQSDMQAVRARETLGADKLIGVSAQTVEQALMAQHQGADYIGVGAVFSTGSKEDAQHVSYDTLREICNAVDIPVIAIGGIDAKNVLQLSGSGICGVAVISALFAQPDVKHAAKELRELTERMVQAS